MKTEGEVSVAVIGAGNIAREHIKAFTDIVNVSIEGIFSRTIEKAMRLAQECGIKNVFSSIEDLWKQTRADLVIITVDVLSMPSVIRDCLKYDWRIFAEKPPSLYVEEALKLSEMALAERKDVRIALNRASYSVTNTVLNEIKGIRENRIIFVNDQQDPEKMSSVGRPAEVVERLMYGNSIHLLDYFRIFARGEAKTVNVLKPYNKTVKPVLVEAHIEYDGGDYGIYQALWNEPGPWSVSINVPDVRYELRPLEEGKRQKRYGKPESLEVAKWDLDFKPGFRRQAEEMVRVVLDGEGNVPTLDDAIATMRLIKRIYGI
jgi:predicted dehydrogenase